MEEITSTVLTLVSIIHLQGVCSPPYSNIIGLFNNRSNMRKLEGVINLSHKVLIFRLQFPTTPKLIASRGVVNKDGLVLEVMTACLKF